MNDKIQRLIELRQHAQAAMKQLTDKAKTERRDLTDAEDATFRAAHSDVRELTALIEHEQAELARAGAPAARTGTSSTWSIRAANAVRKMGGESRAVVSGSIDIPSLVEASVTPKARPERLLDLVVERQKLTGNAFEYYRQSVRTNNAAPVADSATKPTSVFTVDPITDRARVIAHLSEAIPLRLLADHAELRSFLDSEMVEGVLDELEYQLISGDGTGENFTGVLSATGTTPVPYDTSVVQTLRSALTAAQVAGERPSAWVLSPADAQAIDLTLESSGSGFLLDGYQATNAGSANVFGSTLPRVISPSLPTGTALLADWSKLRLYVRESVRLDIDTAGDLFEKNQAKLRAEGRFGMGLLRPSAFFKIDLTAA